MPSSALSTSEIQRLIEEEAMRQGLNPAVVVAIARQESWLNPNAVGDNGKSLGLFQLQRAAAIDAGIDPNRRGEPRENIRGGVTYFKQKLQQSKGNVEQALSRYNRGTPTYQGIGDPRYVENVLGQMEPGAPRQGLLARMGKALSPASAEAATFPDLPDRPPAGVAVPTVQGRPDIPDLPDRPPAGEAVPTVQGRPDIPDLPDRPPAAGVSPAPAAAAPPVLPAPAAPPTTPSLLSRFGQAAQTASRGTLAGQVWPFVQPVLQAQYGAQLEKLPQAGVAGAISAGSAMLGTAAGTYAAPFTGPLAPAMPLVGEMAVSYLGRQLNIGLGLEEPGWKGDVASVALPPVVRGATRVLGPAVTRAAKAVTRRLPGAQAAMHEDIAARLTTTEGTIRPQRPVADYYAEAARYNPSITPSRLHATATDIIQGEMRLQPAARNTELLSLAEGMRDLSLSHQGSVPLQLLDEHRQRIGETVRAWRNRGDTGERQIRRLYGAFHEDMERAANRGVPGAQELRTAIGASRAEHTAEDFLDLFRPGSGGITVDPQGRIQFHGGRLRTRWNNRLRDDPVFAGGITPQVHAEVDDIITQAQRLERLRPPRGAQYGSGRIITRAVAGRVVGGEAGQALAVIGPDVLAAAMQTARGRAAVRWALQQGGGRINADDLVTIAAVVRPAAQEAVTPPVSETGGGPVGP